ncbi:MAG TPA: superoxide dismutase family protein [Acidimicrobiales bacterium]|nr:superoxide dismutase family protein [Acidimicrobiales bacterium]
MRPNRWLSMAALALTLAACGGDDDDDGSAAQTTVTTAPAPAVAADMIAADGSPAGRVTFTEEGGRLRVEARLTNLPPGFHGFHIHAVGKCDRGTPPFTSAGGHLAVGGQAHPAHAGDQPVVLVMADRSADIRFTTDRYKLPDLQVAEGRAVIVHALPDNYANVPTRYARQPDATTLSTGDAGDRIACGVVGGGSTPSTSFTSDTTSTTSGAPGSTTTTRAGSTTTARAAGTLNCQTIAFTPNSEDAASSVTATGLSCAEAEAFVRIAGRQTSSGGPAQVNVEGYRCVRVRSVQDPLPQAFYECTSGTKKVTFTRS